MNIYRHTFTCQCPSDGEMVGYSLEIRSSKMIRVEDILSACDVGPHYHEDLADKLRALGGEQVLTAVHQGVSVRTERSASGDAA
jgi:hypothetical protein